MALAHIHLIHVAGHYSQEAMDVKSGVYQVFIR
jgi:hypothetical protein